MMREGAEIRKMIFSTMTGLSGIRVSSAMIAGVDNALQQDSTQFQALVSDLNEYVEAHNTALQEQRAMEAATAGFAGAMIGAVVGAVVGFLVAGPVGLMFGFSMGQQLGQMIADQYENSKYPTYAESFNPQAVPQSMSGTGVGASMDAELFNIQNELFANGTIDAGDGNIGVNTTKVVQLEQRMQAIFVTELNILSTMESRSKTLKAIWQSMGVVTDEAQSMSNIIQANFQANMRSFQYAVQMVGEQVEVHNRANAAQQALDQSTTKLEICGPMILISAALGSQGIAYISIANSVTGLTEATIDMIYAALRSRDEYGQLKQMTALTPDEVAPPDKNDQDQPPEWKVAEKLDQQEQRLSLNQSNIDVTGTSVLGGDEWGVNSGALTSANQKLDAIYYVKQIIADVLSQQRETQARVASVFHASGLLGPTNTMEKVLSISREVASQMLQAQMQGLEQLVGRHNTLHQAKERTFMAELNFLFRATQATLAIYSEVKTSSAINNYQKAQQAAQRSGNPKDGPTPQQEKDYLEAVQIKKDIGVIELSLTATQTLSEYAALLLFQIHNNMPNQNGNSSDNAKNKENVAVTRQALSTSGGTTSGSVDSSAAQGQSINNMGGSLDGMVDDTATSSDQGGAAQMETQLDQIFYDQSKQMLEQHFNTTKTAGSEMTSYLDNIKPDTTLAAIESDRARADLSEGKKTMEAQYAAFGADVRAYNQIRTDLAKFQAEQVKSPNSSNLNAQMDSLENKLQETEQKLQVAEKKMQEDGAKLMKTLKDLQGLTKAVKTAAAKSNPKLNFTASTGEKLETNEQVNASLEDMEYTLQSANKELGEIRAELKRVRAELARDPENPALKVKLRNLEQKHQAEIETRAENFSAAAGKFDQEVMNSQALADVAEVQALDDLLAATVNDTDKELDDGLKGKKLSEMSSDDVQQYYNDMREKVFIPARKQLHALVARRQEILKRMQSVRPGDPERQRSIRAGSGRPEYSDGG